MARAASSTRATSPACRRASSTRTSSTVTTRSSWDRSRRLAGTGSSTSPARRTPARPTRRSTRARRRSTSSVRPRASSACNTCHRTRRTRKPAAVPTTHCPGAAKPYFLKAGEGPRHTLYGQTTFQVVTGAESDGTFGMTVTEGPTGSVPAHVHEQSYEAIFCLDGRLRVTADGEDYLLTRGDFFSVPAGVEHSLSLESHLTSWATMYGPAGVERFYELAGEVCQERIFVEEAGTVDNDRVAAACSELDVSLVIPDAR